MAGTSAPPPNNVNWPKWNDVPLWYRVLDRFGLPTLFVIFLLGAAARLWTEIRTDWREQNKAMLEAIREVSARVKENSEADAHIRDIILDRVQREPCPPCK